MDLTITNTLEIDLSKYDELYKKLADRTLKILDLKKEFIMSVTFVDKETIHQINLNYRNIDRETDVISFAFLDDESEKTIKSNFPIDLGEIYICYDIANENREKYGNSIERELCFLFVHGLLHLLGYDHMEKDDEKIMFSLQDKILEGFNIYMDKNDLIKEAIKARENSYAIYSKFKVGAALLTKDGRVFYGANIESSSYGLTCCAERSCLFSAYSQGIRKDDIIAFAVVGDTKGPISPCGACRQVLCDLVNGDVVVYLANLHGDVKEFKVSELLPYFFDGSEL